MEMRKSRYIILTALVIIATLRASAQTGNQIVVGDIQMKANSEKSLSVSMNNVDKVVAVELSLNVPNGFLVDPNSVTLSDRAQDHQVTARNIDGNRYSIVEAVFSASATLLAPRSLAIMDPAPWPNIKPAA